MAIEIVDFPMNHGGSFHSYVSLPEGMTAFWHFGFVIPGPVDVLPRLHSCSAGGPRRQNGDAQLVAFTKVLRGGAARFIRRHFMGI